MLRAMKIFIVTAVAHMHVRGQWGSKKNKMHCGDKFPRNELRTVDRDFRGVLHTRDVLQNKYRGTVESAGMAKQREFFLSGFFSRMLPLLARCIIVKMSNRFLRTRGGRRPRWLSSNSLARFRFENCIPSRFCDVITTEMTVAENQRVIDYIVHANGFR